MWCQNNNLSLNVSKIKELIVEYKKRGTSTPPSTLTWPNGAGRELQVSQFPNHKILKMVQTNVHSSEEGATAPLPPQDVGGKKCCTIDSILTVFITNWYGNSTALDRMALQRVVWTTLYTTGAELPAIQDIFIRRSGKKAWKIVKNYSLCFPTASSTGGSSLAPTGS